MQPGAVLVPGLQSKSPEDSTNSIQANESTITTYRITNLRRDDCADDCTRKGFIRLENIENDTLSVSGSWAYVHESDCVQSYRWYLYKNGRWWGIFIGKEANPDLRCIIEPGDWRIVRYTDFHQGETIAATTRSNEIWFHYLGRDRTVAEAEKD